MRQPKKALLTLKKLALFHLWRILSVWMVGCVRRPVEAAASFSPRLTFGGKEAHYAAR